MNRAPCIAILYGKGRPLLDVLERVHTQLPDAAISVVVPPEYPVSDAERARAAEVIQTDLARYSWHSLGPLFRLIQQLRAARFDRFIILFDTPRQRLIARCVNAPACSYCRMDGHLVPIHPSVFLILADTVLRNARGRLTYAALRLIVRLFPVRHVK